MFDINLYPERSLRREAVRRRVLSAAWVASLGALGTVLLVALLLNGWLLRERRQQLEQDLTRLTQLSADVKDAPPELEVATQLAQIRNSRILWSPKLVAIADPLSPSLRLLEVRAAAARKGQGASLELLGLNREGGGMDPVVALLDSLRSHPSIARDFTVVNLGQLEGAEVGRFHVICRGPEPEAPR